MATNSARGQKYWRTLFGVVALFVACEPAIAQSPVFGPLVSSTTTASCLAATIVTAPCVAFQSTFTALGVSGTTGTLTLYTANAPANATFQICPNTTINTAGTAGLVALEATFTTPGGTVRNPSVLLSTSLTTAGNQIGSCASFTMTANSTFSFLVLASAGTGTPVWETEPVVIRLR